MSLGLGISLPFTTIKGFVGFCEQYQTVYDAMTTPPSAAVATAQNVMVKALVDGGVWAKTDYMLLLAQETNDDSEALINWVNPGTNDATLVNAPAFVSLEGFTGNGVDSYINTNFNETTDATYYALNDSAFAFYCRTDKTEISAEMGAERGAGGRTYLLTRYATDDQILNMNSSGLSGVDTGTDSSGMFICQRTASNALAAYRNKVEQFSGSTASGILPNYDWSVCGVNDDGTTDQLSTRQVSFAWIGASLTSDERTVLTDAVETYMDSNGKGVA